MLFLETADHLPLQVAQDKAAGKSTATDQAQITQEQTKLTTNISLDVKAAGQASASVA